MVLTPLEGRSGIDVWTKNVFMRPVFFEGCNLKLTDRPEGVKEEHFETAPAMFTRDAQGNYCYVLALLPNREGPDCNECGQAIVYKGDRRGVPEPGGFYAG
jgi:hypothetical protein